MFCQSGSEWSWLKKQRGREQFCQAGCSLAGHSLSFAQDLRHAFDRVGFPLRMEATVMADAAKQRRRVRRQRQRELQSALRKLRQSRRERDSDKPAEVGVPRTSLGALSEAARVFDTERLKEIIAELAAQLEPLDRDARLQSIEPILMLVDGTLISALPSIMEASWRKQNDGSGLVKWRLHTHFEVDRYVPTRIDVTPNGGGEDDERAVLGRTIESDRLYVMDRGYAKFALFNQIVAAKSSYVCRLRDNSAYEIIEERELTDADRAAGIISDQIVLIGQSVDRGQRAYQFGGLAGRWLRSDW